MNFSGVKGNLRVVKFLTYVIAIIMIINCNSMFITGIHSGVVNKLSLLLMLISVSCLIYINELQNVNLSIFFSMTSFLVAYIVLYIILQRNNTAIKSGVVDLVKFIMMFSLVYLVYKTKRYPYLFKAYCNIIVIIALISLLFWIIGSNWHLINPTNVYISNWSKTTVPSYYDIYFEPQRFENTVRNSAIFAEAPMASLSFSIALCLEVLYPNFDKFYIFKVTILSLAIISTLSTTGYICLIIILGYKMIIKNYSNNYINILKIVIIPLILVVSINGVRQFLVQKMGTSSGISRGQDYLNCFKAWKYYPFLGAGIGAGESNLIINGTKLGNFGYSNSFGKLLGENGLYIFTLYFISVCRSVYISIRKSDFNRLLLTIILIYLFVTTMWTNTYVMSFLFSLIAVWQPDTKDYTQSLKI